MGGAGRVRYRHLKRTVIAVLATIAFLLVFGLVVRAALEAEPTRNLARKWIEETVIDLGAEIEIGDLHWGLLPPSIRLHDLAFSGAGVDAEIDSLQVDLGRIWLTQRTIELGRVTASGVRLSLTGLPRATGKRGPQVKVRVRQLALEVVSFEGVDLPGKIAVDLDGLRSSWSTDGGESRGVATVERAQLRIGKMEPIDFSLATRFVLDDRGFDISHYRINSQGFALEGRGRIDDAGVRSEARGPLDVAWLDSFIGTHGLLNGAAEVEVVLDTSAPELVRADISARHLEAAGFPLDDVEGELALVGRSLRGTLERGRFHGGSVRGTYELGELGGQYPHSVHLEGEGVSLEGVLDNIAVESAGLAANMDLRADARWNGSSFPAGHGNADLTLRGATPGTPVSGEVAVALTGEGFLRFNAENLSIGNSRARWQGALTLASWQPSWSIAADPAVFAEIGPMVNAWTGSAVLPDNLAGTGQLQVEINGPWSELTVGARVDAEPLILDPIELDRLVADAIITGSMLRLGSARFQVGDGFGEIEGGLAWGEAAGDDQIDLQISGRRLPMETVATWAGVEVWVDQGSFSFSGVLDGPLAAPTGTWLVGIEDPVVAGLELGAASTRVEYRNRSFTFNELSFDRGLTGDITWAVDEGEVGGNLAWPRMPLDSVGREAQRLIGDSADVSLEFMLPFGEHPIMTLRGASELAHIDLDAKPDEIEIAAGIEGAVETHAILDRGEDGGLSGDGTLKLISARELLTHVAPGAGVPLSGTAEATFSVDWKDQPLPRIEGTLDHLALELDRQPVQLIRPAEFSLSGNGFVVPGLELRAREDDLFVRWAIDPNGKLRGNLSGTMDALLLRFLLPDWEPAGRATGIVEVLGEVGAPLFEGIAEIHKGSFRLPGTRTILSQVEGTVLLSSGDVQLDGMDFRIMGGRGRAGGQIRERDGTIVLALDGTANGVRFEVLPDLDARISGSWRLIGPVDDLLLSGDLTVDHMSLTSKEDVATILLGWLEGDGGPAGSSGLNLALRIDAEDTIDLRNPFVRLTGSASLEVTGSSNRPGLVGHVEVLEGGEATLLGNRYEIERGSLNFSNPDAIEPFIELQASTWIQEYQITVQISGTPDHFVTTAVSTPPLSTPDIYSLLGVGSTGQGYGTGAVGLGLASSILSSELTSALSRRARLALPVDQVRVDPFAANSTGNPTARLSVIKQLTPSWTVILQTTLSGEREQIVVSRWYLAPGLFLEAGQHEDNSYSLDLKLRRPY